MTLESELQWLKTDLVKITKRAYEILDHPSLTDKDAAILERAMDCFEDLPDILDSIKPKQNKKQLTREHKRQVKYEFPGKSRASMEQMEQSAWWPFKANGTLKNNK